MYISAFSITTQEAVCLFVYLFRQWKSHMKLQQLADPQTMYLFIYWYKHFKLMIQKYPHLDALHKVLCHVCLQDDKKTTLKVLVVGMTLSV